jgi:hypothetical protein
VITDSAGKARRTREAVRTGKRTTGLGRKARVSLRTPDLSDDIPVEETFKKPQVRRRSRDRKDREMRGSPKLTAPSQEGG